MVYNIHSVTDYTFAKDPGEADTVLNSGKHTQALFWSLQSSEENMK